MDFFQPNSSYINSVMLILNAIRFYHDLVVRHSMVALSFGRGECESDDWRFVRVVDRVMAGLNGKPSSTV